MRMRESPFPLYVSHTSHDLVIVSTLVQDGKKGDVIYPNYILAI